MDVLERFLKYVKIDTQSDPDCSQTPSTEKQFDLARVLVDELKELGITQVELTDDCYVYAKIPGNLSEEEAKRTPKIGFIAHLDTAPSAPGANVNPQVIHNYDGEDIVLQNGAVTSVKIFPELKNYKGDDLVVTDGTTLLGADDKAGVAEIMALADYLVHHPEEKHGEISLGFTPDEELGLVAEGFNIEKFDADFAYTLDGGAIGEIIYENFNAASAQVFLTGVEVHPGSSKGKMVNSLLIAREFSMLLPECTPANTEKYEGFFHLDRLQGNVEKTFMDYIIRDHDRDKFEKKKEIFLEAVDFLKKKYEGTGLQIECRMKNQYFNMREKIEPYPFLIEAARNAYRSLGIEPWSAPMRGGTDGAKYSYQGLPCPNLAVGGGNFHGKYEYASVQKMEQMVQVILKISQELIGKKDEKKYKQKE